MPPKLNFVERLEALSKLQVFSDYQHAHALCRPRCSAEDAQEMARDGEQIVFDQSNDAQEYHADIAKQIESLNDLSDGVGRAVELPSGCQEVLKDGVPMGRYTNANHHMDGLFSSIFRANAPEDCAISSRTPAFEELPYVVALKVTNPSAMGPPHDSEREVRLLKKMDHPHVIELLEGFTQPGGQLVLSFPYMQHTLDDVLANGRLPQADQKTVLSQLMQGIEYMHSRGIIHRDIKPSNILLQSPRGPLYIADFGIAWSPDDRGSEPADSKILDVGTTSYRPPELLFGNQSYNTSLDMWAAGCVAAQVVSLGHETLFDAGDLGSELALIKSVFSTLGTPTLDVWPEAAHLPDWGKMAFYEYPAKPWLEILPGATHAAVELVKSLVVYESGDRMKAADWRKQTFFA